MLGPQRPHEVTEAPSKAIFHPELKPLPTPWRERVWALTSASCRLPASPALPTGSTEVSLNSPSLSRGEKKPQSRFLSPFPSCQQLKPIPRERKPLSTQLRPSWEEGDAGKQNLQTGKHSASFWGILIRVWPILFNNGHRPPQTQPQKHKRRILVPVQSVARICCRNHPGSFFLQE